MLSQINRVILKSLETGDKYGLEIQKDIEEFTDGKVILKQPTLYSSLRRMEKRGYISSFWQDSTIGGRRHYYSLTEAGKAEMRNNIFEFSERDIAELLKEVNKGNDIQEEEPQEIELIPAQPAPAPAPIQEVVQEPVKEVKEDFEKFDPNELDSTHKSFSQQMRQYVEPESIEKTEPLAGADTAPESYTYSYANEPDIEFITEEPKHNKNEINYKDILGELDANRPVEPKEEPSYFKEPNINNIEKISLQQKPTEAPKKSDYARQVQQILTSKKTTPQQAEITEAIYQKHHKSTQSTLEEINRRYNLKQQQEHNDTVVANIQPESVGYSHVKQENITIKSYSKDIDESESATPSFLNINKFNLCRGIIMSVIFILEVLISYFVLQANGKLYAPYSYLFWVFMGMTAVYMGVILLLTLKDINKKERLKDISWSTNLLYRFLLTIGLVIFVMAIILCFGGGFSNPELFTLWYLPILAISNILVSWIVGIIIYATKKFRV